MNVQSFKTTRVPILGLPLGNRGKKGHLDVVFAERHIVYYRGMVPPPKGCKPCKACA